MCRHSQLGHLGRRAHVAAREVLRDDFRGYMVPEVSKLNISTKRSLNAGYCRQLVALGRYGNDFHWYVRRCDCVVDIRHRYKYLVNT